MAHFQTALFCPLWGPSLTFPRLATHGTPHNTQYTPARRRLPILAPSGPPSWPPVQVAQHGPGGPRWSQVPIGSPGTPPLHTGAPPPLLPPYAPTPLRAPPPERWPRHAAPMPKPLSRFSHLSLTSQNPRRPLSLPFALRSPLALLLASALPHPTESFCSLPHSFGTRANNSSSFVRSFI